MSGQLSVSRSERSCHERSASRYSMFHYFVISPFFQTCRSACFAKDQNAKQMDRLNIPFGRAKSINFIRRCTG